MTDKKTPKPKGDGIPYGVDPSYKVDPKVSHEEAILKLTSGAPAATDVGFSDFMSSLSLESLETVRSSSGNVYVMLATKEGSQVGVSLTLEPKMVKDKAGRAGNVLTLVLRFLEIPGAAGSVFTNLGEERAYRRGEQKVKVIMLPKLQVPLCPAQVSAWELGLHLKGELRMQVAEYAQTALINSGCAINCKTKEEIANVLFTRLDQLPEEATTYWEPLLATNAPTF